MTTPESIDRVLDFATLNRFNNLLVQVRGRGDALYRSDLVSRSKLLLESQFDPLEYILTQAHKRGIKVHAWVNVYLLWSAREWPYAQDHLLLNRQNWLDTKGEWPLNIDRQLKSFNNGQNGKEGLYLAPNHPEVNKYLLSVFRELVAKYEIDGLHLDYVRYHGRDYGYNPYAIATYRQETGASPPPSTTIMRNSTSADPTASRQAIMWDDFRRRAITDLVRQTRGMLREVRPQCILSAAVKPNLYVAREQFLQEWDVWLAANYVDWVIPMNYTPNIREFAKNIDVIYDNLPSKYRNRIIMGVATYNQVSEDAADKIKYTHITHFPGISLFSYNTIQKNPLYFAPIREALFP